MKLACASCGAAIPGDDIDLPRGVGRCALCGADTPLPGEGQTAFTTESVAALVATIDSSEKRSLGFRRDALPWRERAVSGGTCFELRPVLAQRLVTAAIAGFFLLFMLTGRGDAIFAVFRAIVGIVAAWPIFKVLQSGLNRTQLTIGAEGLRIARGPLPERRAVTVPLANILSFAAGPASILPTLQADKTAWGVRLLTADRNLIELPLRSIDRDDAAWMAGRLNLALEEARGAVASTRLVANPAAKSLNDQAVTR